MRSCAGSGVCCDVCSRSVLATAKPPSSPLFCLHTSGCVPCTRALARRQENERCLNSSTRKVPTLLPFLPLRIDLRSREAVPDCFNGSRRQADKCCSKRERSVHATSSTRWCSGQERQCEAHVADKHRRHKDAMSRDNTAKRRLEGSSMAVPQNGQLTLRCFRSPHLYLVWLLPIETIPRTWLIAKLQRLRAMWCWWQTTTMAPSIGRADHRRIPCGGGGTSAGGDWGGGQATDEAVRVAWMEMGQS